MNNTISNSEEFARLIRRHSLEMVHRARASHIGSALSICDILAVLYSKVLNFDPNNIFFVQRDRFILSKGHACAPLYAALAELGFFPTSQLLTYSMDHSVLMAHISHKVPGVEFSTGSLGHGLPFGVGKALAAKRLKLTWRSYVLLSDGELGEGSNWEALMFAAHHKLSNLVAILDYNKLQALTTVDATVRIEPLEQKIRSFGWAVQEVDGHDHSQICQALQSLPWEGDKPSFLIAHTIKGKGVSFMEDSVAWHYRCPSDEDLCSALKELGYA